MQRKSIGEIGIGKFVTGAIVVALALGAAVFYMFYTGRFGGGSRLKITSPARVGYEWSHLAADNNIVSDYMFGRTKKLIVAKGGDGILAATSYKIAGRLVTQEAEDSGIYGLSDQALLLKCYVRAGDRNNAVALKEEVVKRFRLPDGTYRAFVYKDAADTGDEMTSVSSMMDWLDAMTEYYVTYGSDMDYKEIKNLAGNLFDGSGNVVTEKISVAKYVESLYVSLKDTSIFTADDEVPPRRCAAYEKALMAVKDGFAGGGYSFYAYATSGAMDSGNYIYCGQSTAAFDITQNLKTMRNLAEAGELDSQSFSEFKGQVINSGRIYAEYSIMTGSYSGAEAFSSYTDGLMIAYFMGDRDLYERLSDTLGKRVATKSTSPALYMIFREEDDRYVFYARENLGTRLATS